MQGIFHVFDFIWKESL